MLKAGKTIPTIGTKIEGKKAAAIFFLSKNILFITVLEILKIS